MADNFINKINVNNEDYFLSPTFTSQTKNYVLAAPSNANGVPSFRKLVAADIPDLSYVPTKTGPNNVNTMYNTGIYNITSGQAENAPKGYGFGQLLVMSYRKHTGNTTTDWASQIYLHNGAGTETGNATGPGNVLYYRTSNAASSNNWFSWQKAVHTDSAYTKVGNTNQPVYIAEDGTATAITAVGAAYGGTGKTTLKDSANTLINALDTGSSDLTANDYVITQYVGGGTTTTTYHRRPASKVVNATLVKAALGTDTSTTTQWLNKKGLWSTPTAADVGAITKLSSSTDNAIVRFNGANGQIQNSNIIIDDNASNVIFVKDNLVSGSTYKVGTTTNLTSSDSDLEWIKALLKQLCIQYPSIGDTTFKGSITPNSRGYYEIYIYSTNTVNTDGLPQYSYGTFRKHYGWYYIIGTNNYTPYCTAISLNGHTHNYAGSSSAGGAAYFANAANLTTTANAIAYYTNTTGTFGTKASANGVLYATSANGALQWGTLPIAQGGTGKDTLLSGQVLVGNGENPITTIVKTSANTANTLVQRDANGDFSARNITMTQGNIGSMTLSGTTIAALTVINTGGGNGLLSYKPSSWTGVTSSQWAVGTVDIQGVIRSNNSDLLHSRAGANSVILDAGNYKTYAYALDGSNTGTKLQISTQAAAYTNGIQFMNSTTKKGSIGVDSNGTVGVYGTKVVLRPQLDASTKGVEVTTTAMYPADSMTLGTASNKWSTVYATTFDGNATTATSLTNFVVSTYTIAANKGVRIKYPSNAPVLISCQRTTGGGRLILIGGGYGEEGTVRNDFTELVSPSEWHFTWSMPQTTGYACTIEIMHHDTSGTATVWVESTAACTFTEITALTSTKTNRTLLHSSNYTDYAVAATAGVTAVTWDATNKKLTRTIHGNTADVMTAAQMSTALGLGTIASKAATDYLPVKYSSLDYTSTTTSMGVYPINSQTHPVTGKIEYGGAIQFGGISTSNNYYAAQLLVSSESGGTSPVHAHIRRMTSNPSWSNWTTLLDNNNYTNYTITKTGTGASGSWGISITGSSASCTGNAATATKSGVAAIWLYPENSNEINFGGTNTSTTIYFGYRTKDSRAIPTKFVFGSSTGTADLQAKTVYLGSGTTSYISSTQYTGNAATATKISAKLATTTKTYLLGTSTAITATAANVEMTGDTGVYLTTTAGQLNATSYVVNQSVCLQYNSTDQSLDFVFV